MLEESIVFEGKIPFKIIYFSHGFLWFIIFGWNIGLLVSIITSLSLKLKITSQRVVLTKGIIAQREEEVEYYRVKDTNFCQGIIQRIFKTGYIRIISDDSSAKNLKFPISTPKVYREKIRGYVREQREKI